MEQAPPPYDSVAALDQAPPADEQFEITISDPVKLGEYGKAHISYRVSTKTSLPQYRYSQFSTIRRFSDFVFLHSRLVDAFPGTIIPPLPEKSVAQKLKVQGNALGLGAKQPPETDDFIAARRRGLNIFIMRVASHPALRYSPDLQLFLEASEEAWASEVGKVTAEANSMQKRLGGTVKLFKGLAASTTTLLGGKAPVEEEDEEYLKQRTYITQLEAHLTEAARQADRLLRKQDNFGGSLGLFSHSMLLLQQGEESQDLSGSFKALGDKVDEVSKQTVQQAASLRETFAQPLAEYARMVAAVRQVMTNRGAALSDWQGLREDVENQRVKIMRLRSSAAKMEKVDEAERALEDMNRRSEAAKEKYELFKTKMVDEMARFQRERAAEVGAVLRDFVVAQAQLTSDTAKAWRQLIPRLDQAAQRAEEARMRQNGVPTA